MKVYITVKCRNEDIPDCLETVSKAVEVWEEKHSALCENDGYCDGIELHIDSIDKSRKLSSEYELDKVISQISDRSASYLRNQQ